MSAVRRSQTAATMEAASEALALQWLCCIVTLRHGWVAQLAEQWTENPRVAGSIPAPATSSEISGQPGFYSVRKAVSGLT